jgi:2-oxoglutarate dehydrogenase E2 component (dihydrolipoamide succinyltransferase)
MATKIIMPQLGEGVIEGTIASWLKNEGDAVELYEPILEIETDKVTTEATAEVAGTLLKILVAEGQTVEVGTVLAIIGESGDVIDDADLIDKVPEMESDEQPKLTPIASPNEISKPPSNGPGQALTRRYTGRVSPVVGRIAEEHKVDLNLVVGSGRNGRITKKDILAFVKEQGITKAEPVGAPTSRKEPSALSPQPIVSSSTTSTTPGEVQPLSSIRRSIAEHMVRSKHTSPHVTTIFDLDLTAVAAHRVEHKHQFAQDSAKLTFTVYIMAAIVQSLKVHPMVNSSWTDAGIEFKKDINIGMATAIPDGLIVPVIKNADSLSLLGLARAVNDLADRARISQLNPDEVQGGTFTLTNHGVSGSLFASPIINQPQCAILSMGKIEKRVKVIDDAIAIRLMAYAGLTFDHRILDGASADAFMSTFKDLMENWT